MSSCFRGQRGVGAASKDVMFEHTDSLVCTGSVFESIQIWTLRWYFIFNETENVWRQLNVVFNPAVESGVKLASSDIIHPWINIQLRLISISEMLLDQGCLRMRTVKVQPGSCETCTRAVHTFESFNKSQAYLSYKDYEFIKPSIIKSKW